MILSVKFLQFIQLAILHFKIELIVLIGDNSTLFDLVQVQKRLNNIIPIIIVSTTPPFPDNPFRVHSFCRGCPTNQLTLIYLNTGHYNRVLKYLIDEQRNTNRMVWFRPQSSMFRRNRFAQMFREFNMVLVELVDGVDLEVFAWSDSVKHDYSAAVPLPRFKEPEGIFRSNDSNALMFRNGLDRWPGDPIVATLFTTMIAPHHLILRLQHSKQLWLSSSTLDLFQLMGNILNFALNISFSDEKYCPPCYYPFPVFKTSRLEKLFDYDMYTKKQL